MNKLGAFVLSLFTVFCLVACTRQADHKNSNKLERLQATVFERAQALSKAEMAYQQAVENLRLAQLTTMSTSD